MTDRYERLYNVPNDQTLCTLKKNLKKHKYCSLVCDKNYFHMYFEKELNLS